jgi:hypothetical protein
MVTNYPQRLTARTTTEVNTQSQTQSTNTIALRAMARIGQWLCGFRGHDSVLHFEGNRVMMRCTSCGHDSPGWEITGRGPRQKFEGDRRRHVLATQRLVLRKLA